MGEYCDIYDTKGNLLPFGGYIDESETPGEYEILCSGCEQNDKNGCGRKDCPLLKDNIVVRRGGKLIPRSLLKE